MAQALYRKWRPQTFEDVVGQDHITTTLKNQIATNRVGHAYLFVGSRGCGKTTTARILAHEINVAGLDPAAPATKHLAEEIAEGRSMDIIEIDAASNNSVENVREIRDKAAFQPNQLRYKVYIIDEVHMLSTAAFNALLKTLEEPPPHVVFILATTDPQKIPATVLSRCQRFNFKRVPVKQIVGRLHTLCSGENIEADEHALMLIARSATGSLRDAISLLDQLASSNSMRITADDVREALGATDSATVRALMDGLAAHDAAAGLDAIQIAVDQGADARQIARQMVDYLRAVLQVKVSQKDGAVQSLPGEVSDSEKLDLANYAGKMNSSVFLRGIRSFSNAINEMRSSIDAQLLLDMAYLECAVTEEATQQAEARTPRQEDVSQRAETRAPKQEARELKQEAGSQRTEARAQPETRGSSDRHGKVEARGAAPETKTPLPVEPGGVVTTEVLRSVWKQLIAEVNASNKPAAALLRSCHPYAVEGDIIRIKADHDLFRQRLDDARNKDMVTRALNQLLNGKFTIQVITGQVEQETDLNDDPVIKVARKLGGVVRE